MFSLAATHPNPWSQYESDSAAVWGNLVTAKNTAAQARDTSVTEARQDFDLTQADAVQARSNTITTARATQQSAEQQANVDAATARANSATILPATQPEPHDDAGLNTNPTIPGAPLLETRPGYTQSPITTNFHGTGLLGCVGPDSDQVFFNRYLTEPITDDNYPGGNLSQSVDTYNETYPLDTTSVVLPTSTMVSGPAISARLDDDLHYSSGTPDRELGSPVPVVCTSTSCATTRSQSTDGKNTASGPSI